MNQTDWWSNAFWSLAPSISVGLIFWFVVRSVIRADRGERKMYAKVEAEERAKAEAQRLAALKDQEATE